MSETKDRDERQAEAVRRVLEAAVVFRVMASLGDAVVPDLGRYMDMLDEAVDGLLEAVGAPRLRTPSPAPEAEPAPEEEDWGPAPTDEELATPAPASGLPPDVEEKQVTELAQLAKSLMLGPKTTPYRPPAKPHKRTSFVLPVKASSRRTREPMGIGNKGRAKVLSVFKAGELLGAEEISRRSDLPRGSVWAYVSDLVADGSLEKAARGRWALKGTLAETQGRAPVPLPSLAQLDDDVPLGAHVLSTAAKGG